MITTIKDLAALFDAEATMSAISRRVYKATDCGAWAELVTRNGSKVFRCGSIVEGIDPVVEAVEVVLPCEEKEIWDAIAHVEAEAKRLWDATHGCEDCGPIQEELEGDIPNG